MNKASLLVLPLLLLLCSALPGWSHCGVCQEDVATDSSDKKEEAAVTKQEDSDTGGKEETDVAKKAPEKVAEAKTLEERIASAETKLKDVGSSTTAGSPFPGKGGKRSSSKKTS
jgi:hypothetical protein